MSTPIVISIASMALFDLDEGHSIYQHQGIDAYAKHQILHEDDPLGPGMAFPLIKKLLAMNTPEKKRFEVTLISRNSADTGLRIFNSIEHHQLPISKAGFTSGRSPNAYLKAFGSHLFLSENHNDIRAALSGNFAAARVLSSNPSNESSPELRIAFDGDSVLFSDDSERIYQEQGLDVFLANEKKQALNTLKDGPFKNFLSAIHDIQQDYPNRDNCPIRTALVTARCAPAHARVVHTLRAWGIRIDEAFFLGGLGKADVLKAFQADIFFDDQQAHCDSASEHVTTAHVPHGIMND